jgi:uncharacterized protein
VRESARKVGGIIRAELPPVATEFLEEQSFAVAGFADRVGRVWASPLFGEPGFLRADSDSVLSVSSLPFASEESPDPLITRLQEMTEGFPLGLLVIDPLERKRMRANGTAQIQEDGFNLHLQEVYSNCPKYIQARVLIPGDRHENRIHTTQGTTLSKAQQGILARADTFYIASHHSERGVDASHRGGMPGFVHVLDNRTLIFPDYAGNRMFNTLGNLEISPEAGLLFLDGETGAILQLTGEAQVLWAEEVTALQEAQSIPLIGAQGRAVRFSVHEWRHTEAENGLLKEYFVSYSPFNPQ